MAPDPREPDLKMSIDKVSDSTMYSWKMALEAENCVLVGELLKNNKKLLNDGWKSDELSDKGSEADAEKSLQSTAEYVWKGRTALHVAARRGDAKLVEQIGEILHPNCTKRGATCSAECHLLKVVDSYYELDALAMAILNGNRRIIKLLKKTSLDCAWNPYDISLEVKAVTLEVKTASVQVKDVLESDDDKKNKAALSKITNTILSKIREEDPVERVTLDKMYEDDCDFNFLEKSLFLFHFTFSTWEADGSTQAVMKDIRERIIFEAKTEQCLKYLLCQLFDGQGRTALHVAVDSNKVREFLKPLLDQILLGRIDEIFRDEADILKRVVNAKDSSGRTPLYRAAAKNQLHTVNELLEVRFDIPCGMYSGCAEPKRPSFDQPNARNRLVDLNEVLKDIAISSSNELLKPTAYQWGEDLDLDRLSWRNNFKSDCVFISKEKLRRLSYDRNSQGAPGIKPLQYISSTPLHVAIILKNERIVKKLLAVTNRFSTKNCRRRFTWPVDAAWKGAHSRRAEYYVTTMKLAVLVGSMPIMNMLLEAEKQKPGLFTDADDEASLPSFHLAAAMGNLEIITAFLESDRGKFNPRQKDKYGNTALHQALKGNYVQLHPHLIDFVDCTHVVHWRWERPSVWEWLASPEVITQKRRVVVEHDKVERKDRIGQRMASINLLLEAGMDIWAENESGRRPNPQPDASEEFVKWWSDKVTKVSQNIQQQLNGAANAISVTAALVATASYVGPLQPPLSYSGDSLQVNILAVRIFAVCDSLSFYLALAAIMLALLPSLPLPEESKFRSELVGSKVLVAAAVSFLLPSIVCVLIAFAAGYIAAMPEHGVAIDGLTVATTLVGGCFCVLVTGIFLARLVRVFIHFRTTSSTELGRIFGIY